MRLLGELIRFAFRQSFSRRRTAWLAILLVTAATLTVSEGSLAQQLNRLSEFEFARSRIGNFELRAETRVHWNADIPMIESVSCWGSNEDIRFEIGPVGRLEHIAFSFNGLPDEDGDRPMLGLLGDEMWLYVDGIRYEYRNIPAPTAQVTNFSYPVEQGERVVVVPWRGNHAVRAPNSRLFVDISRIQDELINARRLEWSFKSRNWQQVDRSEPSNRLPPGWERRRYRIDNARLKEAVDWCTEQVDSAAARSLPT